MVVYGGDNQVVKHWLQSRKAGIRAGRILVRVVNMVEIRHGCVILAGWWRTYHNVDSDYLTRCNDEEYEEFCRKRDFEAVEVRGPILEALKDTEKFGPCFLSWGQDEDRAGLQRLKEKRMLRQLQKELEVPWQAIYVCEWAAEGREVKDFEVARSLGAIDRPSSGGPALGCATLGVDRQGIHLRRALDFFKKEGAWVGIVEGPRQVAWSAAEEWCARQGWHLVMEEFVTTEFGEALARRRQCLIISRWAIPEGWKQALVRVGVPVPMATILRKKEWNDACWIRPERLEVGGGGPQQPLLPQVVGHVWWEKDAERMNLHGTSGPGRWPLLQAPGGPLQEAVVFDRRGPPGAVRRLTMEELWRLKGRTLQQLKEKKAISEDEERWAKEGARATGVHTAASLLSVGGFLVVHHMEEQAKKAGMGRDDEGAEALAQLLQWLRRWRKKDYERAGEDRYAGGQVWRWAEAWWQEQLEESSDEERYAGGRRKKTQEVLEAVAAKTVSLGREVAPFCGEVRERIDEWLEDHMSGDKATATEKAYGSMWQKWKAWCGRQGWPSPYLNHKEDSLENENKILGFMGYLGWLGSSSATLKQALFAIKDAHKKGGAGDPTSGMHRLWILTNAMDRQAVRRPRRLGVTPGMLVWIGKKMIEPLEAERTTPAWADCVVVVAALTTAWFFMLRAREFSDSGGVDEESVVRGCDLKFSKEGELAPGGGADEVTLQFRKTKADQLAFGESKTLKATGKRFLCPVEALETGCEVHGRKGSALQVEKESDLCFGGRQERC